ncbi:MAG TPA: hypothetical protein PLF40_29805 [Kofleriaceae bacterium]|nr:hypothetical protein [Kofleriaceae bacterium]
MIRLVHTTIAEVALDPTYQLIVPGQYAALRLASTGHASAASTQCDAPFA